MTETSPRGRRRNTHLVPERAPAVSARNAPQTYTRAVAEMLDTYRGAGTVTSVCEHLGITSGVFYRWMSEDLGFKEHIEEIRAGADDRVESALLKRALGYSYDTTETKTKNGGEEVTITEKTVHVEPDPGSAKFWLTNRRRDQWAERKVVEGELDFAKLVDQFFDDMRDITPEDG